MLPTSNWGCMRELVFPTGPRYSCEEQRPQELIALKSNHNMKTTKQANPILPAPGVSRNHANDVDASRSGISTERQYDVGSSNQSWRESTDNSTESRALLRCRKQLKIATYNINTMRDDSKAEELSQCAEKYEIDIIGIQEHRIIHQDPVEYRKIGNRYLITSSGWRNEVQASQGGVGLLLGRSARKSLLKATKVHPRVLVAEFDGNPKCTVIVIYSPTNSAPEEEVEEFYNVLKGTIQDIPAHNFVAVIGDFNARLGPDDARYTYHESTNRNGTHLADLMLEYDLLATNTEFRKRKGKLWTFRDNATNSCRQLDYILVRKKWRNSVKNAEAYNSFNTARSDHRVVTANVRLSLRVPKAKARVKYDWQQFACDQEMQHRYTVAVRNRFQFLENGTNDEEYTKFVQANEEAMEECVPKRKGEKKTLKAEHPDIIAARMEVESAHSKFTESGTSDDETEWKMALKYLYDTYDRLNEEDIATKVSRIEEAHGDRRYGEAWKVVNEVSGRKNAKEGQVSGSSPEERVNTWFTHFKKLLGSPPEVDDPNEEIPVIYEGLDIDDGPFTELEYKKVKTSLKIGKSSGPDGIPPEVFKYCQFDDICLKFCNLALMKNDKPEIWSFMNIIPVPKSGDLSVTDNYRGISLTCVIAKMYNRMILNRIRSALDVKLRRNQNGFRTKRTTVAQILALRRVLEGVRANNLPAVLTFIDFKKAFDSIHRGKMMKILRAYGIPPRLVQAIEAMYRNTRARIVTPDGETELFDITAGVLQGDTLAPFLFIIVLDYALRRAIEGKEEELGFTIHPRRSSRFPKETLTDLDFADDIALLSDLLNQAQELLVRVQVECKKVGLGINAKKTKYLTYNINVSEALKTSEGTELERKEDFKYLGSWIDSTEKDIRIRKAQAWQALNRMRNIWESRMSRGLKIRFFLAAIESILLYGCESWTVTPQMERSLNGTYTCMLRKVLNVKWRSHTTNAELYGELPPVGNKIATRRMQLAGHCHRHPEMSAHKLVLWQPTHGQRTRGRPRQSYVEVLRQDAGGVTAEELGTLMDDRAVWRKHVVARLKATK